MIEILAKTRKMAPVVLLSSSITRCPAAASSRRVWSVRARNSSDAAPCASDAADERWGLGRREALGRVARTGIATTLGAALLDLAEGAGWSRAEDGITLEDAVPNEALVAQQVAEGADQPPAEDFVTRTAEPDDWYGFEDIYDDYFVLIPPEWNVVTTSGADMFYRNTLNVEQNMFVALSSKSFSKFKSLPEDFGTPQQCAEAYLQKYMGEFTSTRLGIQRNGRVVAAAQRTSASDGDRQFYDFLINIDSYAARNQYGITSSERVQSKEWDRYFLTTIGIQGDRLCELRLQCSKDDYEKDREELLHILHSFQLHANSDFPAAVPDNLRGKKKSRA